MLPFILFFSIKNNRIDEIENIDVVQKILNSYLMHYYISKTSISIEGGYPCYQKNFIEKFTCCLLCTNEIDIILPLRLSLKISMGLFVFVN